ncbi:hypothetical protein B0J11DRAFT_288525 [Dendryphion nanum]|uniref:Telomere replication protein EST3 n=1 Tax=Dendryphion nanum TaxID=256645 RepID=A0A9P9DYN5_9PLEO|nr:hypothetical protein B0J11DRAFT_288525 [Dendryphion nanum]
MAHSAWLEKTIALQLRLCLSWLQRPDEEPDRWLGLYEDNESCIDIVCNDLDLDLDLAHVNPFLILSDGHTCIRAALTSACETHLATRSHGNLTPPTLHSTIKVHYYTLRYTSYGPPADKLHIIIDSLDYQSSAHVQVVGSPKPIHEGSEFVSILKKFDTARRHRDRKFTGSDTDLEGISDTMSQQEPIQQGDDEPFLDDGFTPSQLSPGTQLDATGSFATQMPLHNVREDRTPRGRTARRHPSGVSSLTHTTNSNGNLEPVSVKGRNHEQIDLSPNSSNSGLLPALTKSKDDSKRNELFLLLKKNQEYVAPPTVATDLSSSKEQTVTSAHAQPALQTTCPGPASSPSHSTVSERNTRSIQPQQTIGDISSPVGNISKALVFPDDQDRATGLDESTKDEAMVGQASWMQGWHFNVGSITISEEQRVVLNRPYSWHKPEVGNTYPAGNMPNEIFKEITGPSKDVSTSEDILATSDIVGSVEAGSGQANINQQSNVLQVATQTNDNNHLRSSVEPPGSPVSSSADDVSWASSPAPIPLQNKFRLNATLPPDSDFDPPERSQRLNDNAVLRRDISFTNHFPSSPVQPRDDIVTSKRDTILTNNLPSSPPLISRDDLDADGDVEMEVQVPQGLGEDRAANKLRSPSPFREDDINTSMLQHAASIVQVEETPYTKVKTNPLTESSKPSPRSHNEASSGTSKGNLSNSMVPGTYYDLDSSAGGPDSLNDVAKLSIGPKSSSQQPGGRHGTHVPSAVVDLEDIEDVDIRDVECIDEAGMRDQVQNETTDAHNDVWMPNQAPYPSSRTTDELDLKPAPTVLTHEFPTKRKPRTSPSKINVRPVKRRDIKIVEFGTGVPLSAEPQSDYLRERRNAIQRLRGRRDRDLIKKEVGAAAHISHSNDQTPPSRRAITLADRDLHAQENVSSAYRARVSREEPPPPFSLSGFHQDQGTSKDDPIQVDITPKTIFELFKDTYPEYTGDMKHFVKECTKMYGLEREDKMIPKWQWDDYLIRNRLDYKEYAIEQLNRDVDPQDVMDYHRFYKDVIRNTKYTQGILKDTATLVAALDELGQRPTPEEQTTRLPPRPLPKAPAAGQWQNSPRHSFQRFESYSPKPTLPERRYQYPLIQTGNSGQNSPIVAHTPSESDRRTRQQLSVSNTPSQQSRSRQRPSAVSRPPNQFNRLSRSSSYFRDFTRGLEKMTSVTGSTEVKKADS